MESGRGTAVGFDSLFAYVASVVLCAELAATGLPVLSGVLPKHSLLEGVLN
jgi:hypothetical protein